MSYQADLLNAYRDQLANIRAAMSEFQTARDNQSGFGGEDLEELERLKDVINATDAVDLEHLYDVKGPLLAHWKSGVTNYTITPVSNGPASETPPKRRVSALLSGASAVDGIYSLTPPTCHTCGTPMTAKVTNYGPYQASLTHHCKACEE